MKLLLTILALLLAAGPAAESYANDDLGVQLELPAGWALRVDAESADALQLTIWPEEAGERVQLSLRVSSPGAHVDAAAVLEAARAEVEASADHRDASEGARAAAGGELPALRFVSTGTGTNWTIEQAYLLEHGRLFVLQSATREGEFSDWEEPFERVWAGFELTELSAERAEELRLRALAGRCGSELDWAADWDTAAARARETQRLVLVSANMIGGFALEDQALTGPFMDPDIVALVQERFVPLQLGKGQPVPFADPELYGMGPSTFGVAILVASPDGHVLSDSGGALDERLRAVLAEHADGRPPIPDVSDPLARADRHARRGELGRAAELLKGLDSAAAWRLAAAIARRERRGADALALLERARAARGSDTLAIDLDVDEGLVRQRLGELREAARLFVRVLAKDPRHPRAAEAGFRLSTIRHLTDGPEAAAAEYERVVEAWPESRWAWKSAATLVSTGFALGYGVRLDWPDEEVYALLEVGERAPLAPRRADRARRDARRWLMEAQRPDGSWPMPSDLAQFRAEVPDDFQLAGTAICARALLALDGDADARAAAGRGVAWVLAAFERRRAHGSTAHFMDYEVWSRAYVLGLVADAVAADLIGPSDAAGAEAAASAAVSELARKQQSGGGWSYYVTTDLAKRDTPADQSISFTTAAVVLALLDARAAGLAVPDGVLDRGLDCLERMRNENGTYEYMLFHADESKRASNPPGSAGRGPVCALALLRGERGDADELEAALEMLVEHRAGLAAELGKALLHTGPDAQGSHYLAFDWATAAEAAAALPRADRRAFVEPLLEEILRGHLADGSFLADTGRGRSVGTGFALAALTALD